MNPQLLLTSLREQDGNFDNLIDVLEAKKRAIVQNDNDALEQAIKEEQKILKNIEREESNRLKIIKEIAGLYSLELPTASMDNLLEQGKDYFDKERSELEKIRASINVKIGRVTQINSQLRDIIDFSRSMIKETVALLIGPNQHSLVNKRV